MVLEEVIVPPAVTVVVGVVHVLVVVSVVRVSITVMPELVTVAVALL